jgi:ABC-2 type transport system ATP-binding protein
MPIREFQRKFKRFSFEAADPSLRMERDAVVSNFEIVRTHATIYTFATLPRVRAHLEKTGVKYRNLRAVPMSLEDAFIGITGKY